MKQCIKCLEIKPLSEFHKHKTARDGHRNACKTCMFRFYAENYKRKKAQYSIQRAKYYRNNEEHIRAKNKARYKNKRKEILAKCKQYAKKNKVKRNAYIKNKKKNDIQYKLACNLRSRLSAALKKGWKSGSAVRDLGCSILELKTLLESKFQPGMTWSNWSRTGWHIDHIKPLSAFDLSNREELLQACHYANLQPLWA